MSLRDAITPFVPGLRRYARGLVEDRSDRLRTADDLVQKTLHRALRDDRLKCGGNIRTLLYATLTSLNRQRLRTSGPVRPGPADAKDAARGASADSIGQKRIERALAALPTDLREVLLLVVLERLTYEETAEVVEVPLATVIARLTRGRDELRVHFNGTVAAHPHLPRQASSRGYGHLRLVK